MSSRFVILHHEVHGGEHWDLMLERDGVLLTWQLQRESITPADLPIPATRIDDHRLAYLDYEGPVSRNRGHVRRVDEGTVIFQELTDSQVVFKLAGKRLCGAFEVRTSTDGWVFAVAR
jgi:hypothetical protein